MISLIYVSAQPLPAIYTVIAWCATFGALFLALSMASRPTRRRLLIGSGIGLLAAYLVVAFPDCDKASWYEWVSNGCWIP